MSDREPTLEELEKREQKLRMDLAHVRAQITIMRARKAGGRAAGPGRSVGRSVRDVTAD